MNKKIQKRIDRNKKYLDNCLYTAERLIDRGFFDEASSYLADLAKFSWGNCTGYYSNWKVEKLLNRLGKIVPKGTTISQPQKNKFRILHVASEIHKIGGHTRLLLNWIKNDYANIHSVVITNQSKSSPYIPDVLLSHPSLVNTDFFYLDEHKKILDKANDLRCLAREYDIIILHIHPDDVIPVIALSDISLPPVGFVNHADHIFWIGSSICDVLIQIRESNMERDLSVRKITKQFFLPIPLGNIEENSKVNYLEARSIISIEENSIALLTVGHEYKYKPIGRFNFFEAIIPLLDSNPNVILFFVGIDNDSQLAKQYSHSQIRYLGVLTGELEIYERACDIYLEGFPFSSYTAMLQVALKGIPIHLMPQPYPLIKLFPEDWYSSSIDEWKSNLNKIIISVEARTLRKDLQRKHLNEYYSPQKWKNRVVELYGALMGTRHAVKNYDISTFYNDENEYFLSALDLGYPIHHLKNCCGVSFLDRLRHLSFVIDKPKNVMINKKEMVKYIFSKGC